MKNDWKVYFKYLYMHLLSGLEYKGWWLMIIQTVVVCSIELLPTVLMFRRMGDIGEWSMERILLIYALAVTSFGLAESFCDGFSSFPWRMLQSGDFDRLLLRPRTLAIQVAGSVFSFHRLTRAVAGVGIIIWTLGRLNVTITPLKAGMILLAIIGGTLMYCGVLVMSSGIAFFTIKALDWIYIFTYASYQVTRIPVDYMPRWMYRMFLFVMPMLVTSYFPAAAVGGWGKQSLGLLSLPAGLLFLGVSLLVWRLGVRHYKGTGS